MRYSYAEFFHFQTGSPQTQLIQTQMTSLAAIPQILFSSKRLSTTAFTNAEVLRKTCKLKSVALSLTHLSSFSMPTVTSQPGNTLAARTGEMQQRPMGLPSPWNACMAALTSSLTEQSFPCTAHVERFFAAPKPPTRQTK